VARTPVVVLAVARTPVVVLAVARTPVVVAADTAVARTPVVVLAVARTPVVVLAVARTPVVVLAVARTPVVVLAPVHRPTAFLDLAPRQAVQRAEPGCLPDPSADRQLIVPDIPVSFLFTFHNVPKSRTISCKPCRHLRCMVPID
jgi:hypothetical protein